MKRKQRTQAGRHCYKCIENFILYTLHIYIGADFLASSFMLIGINKIQAQGQVVPGVQVIYTSQAV